MIQIKVTVVEKDGEAHVRCSVGVFAEADPSGPSAKEIEAAARVIGAIHGVGAEIDARNQLSRRAGSGLFVPGDAGKLSRPT